MALLFAILVALGATYALLLLAWHVLRRVLVAKHIGTTNLHLLQQGRAEHDKIPGTAVVCGGGIAGLLTARVCHEHFERVLVIEAEPWLSTEDARRVDGWKLLRQTRSRLIQWNSLHSSQAYFFAGLQKLFPNIIEEAARSQIKVAPSFPRFSTSGAPWRRPQRPGGLPKTMYTTRHTLETFIRRLVLDPDAYPHITFRAGTVTDVVPDPADNTKLSQVVFRNETGAVETVDAALVADCSGPARAGLKWLARHGYGSPPTPGSPSTLPLEDLKIALDQKLRYSSITYTAPDAAFMARFEALLPDEFKGDGPVITFLEDDTEATKATGRAYLIVWRLDANQICVFAGHTGEVRFQPTNVEQLRQYARSVYEIEPIAEYFWGMLDLLEEIEDTAVVSLLRVPPTSYVRYSRATNMPSNFVALGDSVIVVNPIFGEGCTKALRCAMALHTELLRANKTSPRVLPHTFAKDFFQEEKDKTEWLWDNTRILDYGVPTTEPIPGESLSEGAGLRWYITWLQRMAPYDDHAALVMYDTVTGFASPIDALHPHLVAKVLWRGLVVGA
ncbi:hypothetical protein HMN09_00669100 [Mycena chlorophos]|uniref:FAD/NAD(P)-binding domain-containing protein n=1 Tax=Mycena chlorophos TaxID=658473 RepID=A0A8H6T0M9_MYCCL|nr:hypothetical protein HMN09_00669100 [Mycena chlorophos]